MSRFLPDFDKALDEVHRSMEDESFPPIREMLEIQERLGLAIRAQREEYERAENAPNLFARLQDRLHEIISRTSSITPKDKKIKNPWMETNPFGEIDTGNSPSFSDQIAEMSRSTREFNLRAMGIVEEPEKSKKPEEVQEDFRDYLNGQLQEYKDSRKYPTGSTFENENFPGVTFRIRDIES